MQNKSPVALVTGSGRHRVGNAVARALALEGYAIALHYHRSEQAAASTMREMRLAGTTCHAFQADVTEEKDVDAMFDAIERQFGRLDVLVTSASSWTPTPFAEVSAEQVKKEFEVNTLGTFLCARRAGLRMAGQDTGGSIITIGDWAIERPYRNYAAYFIAKGALPTMTRTLAVELAHRNPNVRVNCIHPGPVMFPPDCSDEKRQELINSTLVKGGDDPTSVAAAVLFFVRNTFVTGTCLPVDGGRTIYASEATSRSRPM